MTAFDPAQDPKALCQLALMWQRGRPMRDDSQRRPQAIAALLTDPSILWYNGPGGSIWYLTDREPRTQAATLQVLAPTRWIWRRRAELLEALAAVMDGNRLRKLYVLIPGPMKRQKRLAKWFAFRHEGTLREMLVFDGRFVNLDIYGLLRRELGREKKANARNESKRKEAAPRDAVALSSSQLPEGHPV